MKKCPKCIQTLPLELFGKNRAARDGLQVYCCSCRKQVRRKWYEKKLDNHKNSVKSWQRKQLEEIRIVVIDYLKEHPCVDCGEDDPVVLEFDHVRGEKKGSISEMVGARRSLKTILDEIDKCDVRCCNCHRRKTAKQLYPALVAQKTEQLFPKEKVIGAIPI